MTIRSAAKRACSPAWFGTQLEPSSFIISDCEGVEGELFCGADAGALDSSAILIELHEELKPGVTAALERQFAGTHDVRKVRSRTATSVSAHVRSLTPGELHRAATETRSPQDWMFAEPRRNCSA